MRAGPPPRLKDQDRYEAAVAVEKEFGVFVVGARRYAAVAYLYEKYGDQAIINIIRDSANSSMDRFYELLTRLTGSDVDGLDAAITAWLLDLQPIRAANVEGRIGVELLMLADGVHGEAVVDETRAVCAFDTSGTQLTSQPGLVGFSVTLGPDGSFTSMRPSSRVGNAVTLTGQVTGDRLSGTYRVVDEANNCNSGEIPFVPTG